MEIRLRTLTPLWTGGVDQTCDRLHETGIIGSLRWWYEAIVRGLGGQACDPTGEDRCTYNPREGPKSVCHACQIFGCTSLSRRFRTELQNFNMVPLGFITTFSDRGQQWPNNAWWLEKIFKKAVHHVNQLSVLFADNQQAARLVLTPKRHFPAEEMDWEAQIEYLLKWIEVHAALGRKIQNGFGQIRTELDSTVVQKGEAALREFLRRPARKVKNQKVHLPSGAEFFKLEFGVSQEDKQLCWILEKGHWIGRSDDALCPVRFIPCAFDVRYVVRFPDTDKLSGLRWKLKQLKGKEFARKLFGEMGFGSRINVSHLMREDDHYRLRVFGFISRQEREPILKHIRETVQEIFPTSKELV